MKKTVISVVLLTAVAGAVAYLQVHRPQPQFCWLVFGPETKVRILARVDGDAISLTHFLNGEPTGRVDRFKGCPKCKNVSFSDPDGKTSYLITRAGRTCGHKAGDPTEIFFHVDISGPLNYRQYCDIQALPCDPDSAQLAHFHGPLAIKVYSLNWEVPSDQSLKRGREPTDVYANIGTFDIQKNCWVVVRFEGQDARQLPLTKEIHPAVDVEFPSKDANGPPIKRRYPLAELVSGVLFHGPVPVPDDAGNGTAKLRLSFDSWTEARITSSTIEVPIADDRTGAG
jgi:hypothetical protein